MTNQSSDGKYRIAVDFDGVIHQSSKGWADGTIYDPPMEGCKEAMEKFLSLGYEVIIFSTRCQSRMVDGNREPGQVLEVEEYLKKHQIPYSSIWTESAKPLVHVFLDDKAVRFADWKDAEKKIRYLAPDGKEKAWRI